MFYKKKPVVIEAVRIGGAERPDWYCDGIESQDLVIERNQKDEVVGCHILTLEGEMYGAAGDYIIRGIAGELYPCKADIFHKTYALVYGAEGC